MFLNRSWDRSPLMFWMWVRSKHQLFSHFLWTAFNDDGLPANCISCMCTYMFPYGESYGLRWLLLYSLTYACRQYECLWIHVSLFLWLCTGTHVMGSTFIDMACHYFSPPANPLGTMHWVIYYWFTWVRVNASVKTTHGFHIFILLVLLQVMFTRWQLEPR